MSGHKKARYERKQKFVGNAVGHERQLLETLFDIMYTSKYVSNRVKNKAGRR
jgi:hypothetical protein